MTTKKFTWNSDGSEIPEVEAHTQARHRITENYIHDWILTLCGNSPWQKKKVCIIEGFSGGGIYRDPESKTFWEGSPLRIMKSIEKGLQSVRKEKCKPEFQLEVDYIFIDSKPSHIDCLRKQIKNLENDINFQHNYTINYQVKEFECIVDKLIEKQKTEKTSSLFILDPTGYSDVSTLSIRRIMDLRKSEILFTFMISPLKRFLSLRENELCTVFRDILEADNYFNLKPNEIQNEYSYDSYLRNEALRLYRENGHARYAYSFALIPSGFEVKYYLIHLANSPSAQRVIKETLWKHSNLDIAKQFKYGAYGLGFRTPDYFDKNPTFFDIQGDNRNVSIQHLSDSLLPEIRNTPEGFELGKLHDATMQTNPSIVSHYEELFCNLRSCKELEIIRNGKPTQARKLKPSDIIKTPQQAALFDLKKYIR